VQWKKLLSIVVPTLALDLVVFFYVYPRPAVIGILGDLYNFFAALWLAYDLLFKEHEVKLRSDLQQIKKDAQGHDLPLKIAGRDLNQTDLERLFLKRAAKEALSACLLLGLGLLLVLFARILEFFEQGRLDELWRASHL
jgi:hypothetical protein